MDKKLYRLMNWPEIEEIIYSDGDDPHRILGAHKVGTSYLIQAFLPDVKSVMLHLDSTGKDIPMELADEAGFFACLVSYKPDLRYSFVYQDEQGDTIHKIDPYSFGPLMDREDFISFGSGIHYDIYQKLGAHLMTRDGVPGCEFAVWAPDAARVSVIGEFNHWDGRLCQMHRLDPQGVFEIFVPGVCVGDEYQFEIKTRSGEVLAKPDPYAFSTAGEEHEISVVTDQPDFTWHDQDFEALKNKEKNPADALSICELSLEDFIIRKNAANIAEVAEDVREYVTNNGFDTIEIQPVSPHVVGHRYHILDFFALDHIYGGFEAFQTFIDQMHASGIRVILEWVPTFFPRTMNGLQCYDDRPLYEYGDSRQGVEPKTGNLIFDYGRKEVTNYLIANALFWVENFHLDGLRLSDISKIIYLDYDRNPGEWIPNIYGTNENLEAIEFIKHLNSIMKKRNPGVLMITKETACWPQVTDTLENGGLGFDLKWNNGWTRDSLSYFCNDPIFRAGHHNELTFSLVYCYTERFIVAYGHDMLKDGLKGLYELMPGDTNSKLANCRLALSYLFMHPGRKHVYMKPDILSIDQEVFLENLMKACNDLYKKYPALNVNDDHEQGFEWINSMASSECMISFVRNSDKPEDRILVVANMAGVSRDFKVGVPENGKYFEIFNSDDKLFGGNGEVNASKIEAKRELSDGRDYSIEVHVAPLSLCAFRFVSYTEAEKKIRKIKEEEELKKQKELADKLTSLQNRLSLEEEKLLKALHERYEKEINEQKKAIEEKYNEIEDEKISEIMGAAVSKISSSKPRTKASSKKKK